MLKETINSNDDMSSRLIFLAKNGEIIMGAFLGNKPFTLSDGRA